MPVRHKFYFACQFWPTTFGFKKGFSASVMWHKAVWTASGQTHWVVMEVATCPGFSSIVLWYQNTSTRMNTDSHTGRAVHSGEKKKMLCGNRRRGGHHPLSAGTRCRLFHVVHVDSRGQRDLSSSPICFSALQVSWTEQRLLTLIWLPFDVRYSRLQHICVFSHQCVIVQYDGCLMLKQDWYYDFGRIFSYQCFKTFIPSSSYLQSI